MFVLFCIVLILLGMYFKGLSDSTAYDAKHYKMWVDSQIMLSENPFTRYHIGNPNDAWHWYSRLSTYFLYGGGILTGICIMTLQTLKDFLVSCGLFDIVMMITFGMFELDSSLWWALLIIPIQTISGLIGFNLGDKWKGSMWIEKLSNVINRNV